MCFPLGFELTYTKGNSALWHNLWDSQAYHSGSCIPCSSYIFFCICFQNLILKFLPSHLMPTSHSNSQQTSSLNKSVFYIQGKTYVRWPYQRKFCARLKKKENAFNFAFLNSYQKLQIHRFKIYYDMISSIMQDSTSS